MHRSVGHCFWLRLAVIAAAAAFIRADARYAYSCPERAAEADAAARTPVAPGQPDRPPAEDKPVSGATFVAVRPEFQDLSGAFLRGLNSREPVSGLHQPVITPRASCQVSLAPQAKQPIVPDLIRATARPIVRHGPPLI